MLKHNQDGSVGVVVGFVILSLFFVGAAGFGVWAFAGRQDYKDNVDSKINTAVGAAKSATQQADATKYAEQAKSPLSTYNGPEAYGSLVINFPKTWSGYVDSTGSNDALVNAYFYPGTVPALGSDSSTFALRVEVAGQSYSQTVQNFKNQSSTNSALAFKAYALPQLPKVIGVRMQGKLQFSGNFRTVDMVILPLRSDTLEIWTEGSQFEADFNKYILPNFSFSP
ncbi:MAG TPA: hypothetical protein VG604_02050 [Candidatus Saccharimonadales bacterium]|nr:hypothetical protein [Candidatus Saccharimonadales bacterium]